MKKITRPLIFLLLSVGLGYIAFGLRSIAGGREVAERHAIWIALQVCLIFAVLFQWGVVIKDGNQLDVLTSERTESLWKIAGLRGYLFLLWSMALEALLVSCIVTFVLFSFHDGIPPLQWQRVGGAFTDWVIDFGIVVLLAVGALFNFFLLSMLLTRGKTGIKPPDMGAVKR